MILTLLEHKEIQSQIPEIAAASEQLKLNRCKIPERNSQISTIAYILPKWKLPTVCIMWTASSAACLNKFGSARSFVLKISDLICAEMFISHWEPTLHQQDHTLREKGCKQNRFLLFADFDVWDTKNRPKKWINNIQIAKWVQGQWDHTIHDVPLYDVICHVHTPVLLSQWQLTKFPDFVPKVYRLPCNSTVLVHMCKLHVWETQSNKVANKLRKIFKE